MAAHARKIIQNLPLATDGLAVVDCGYVVDTADAVAFSAIHLYR